MLHSQSWDHRLMTKLHDGKLREMELEPIPGNNLTWGDHERGGPSWQRSQRVKQVESAQGRLQVFMAKIQRQEREDQFKMSKEKKKILRLKHQETSRTTIDSSDINVKP